MNVRSLLVGAVWAVLPAYLPNSVAVLVGGGPPIDGGRSWRGRRLLGDGKTWRGALGGVLGGVLVAQALNAVRDRLGLSVPRFPPTATLSLPLGAMLGDMAGSFLKRRLGFERGASVPLLDQLGFLVVGLGLTGLLDPGWSRETFTPGRIVFLAVATPAIHLVSNAGAYLLGLKDEPW